MENNCCKWLEISVNSCKWLEWLDGWKWLELEKMAGHEQTWLEFDGDGWKCLEISGNGLK